MLNISDDQSRARSALQFFDSDDRKEWVDVGAMLHSTGWGSSKEMWFEWSRTSEKFSERDAETVWKSFKPGGGLNIETLFFRARNRGWNGTSDGVLGPLKPSSNGIVKSVAPSSVERPQKVYTTIKDAEEAISYRIRHDEKFRGCTEFRVKSFLYHDETGVVVTASVRVDYFDSENKPAKTFRMVRAVDGGFSIGGMDGVRPLYQLPLVAGAKTVVIVEGEKAADSLNQLFGSVERSDVIATTSICGSQSPGKSDWSTLAEKQVYLWPDADEAGEKYLESVATLIVGVVRVIRPAGMPEKSDAFDWLNGSGPFGDAALPDEAMEHLEKLLADALAHPTGIATEDAWPDVVPFTERDLPMFPMESLPDVLRKWVNAESIATQTPHDLAALLSLASCAVLLAKRIEVEPRTGWREPVNLFVAVLLEPANRKSAVFTDVTAPLRSIELQMIHGAMSEIYREESMRRQDEMRLKKLEKLASEKGDLEAREQAKDLSVELALRPRRYAPRLLCDDATAEKIGILLDEQGGRLASMSAEGGVFDLMAGKYSSNGGTNFDVYLKGHAGDAIVTDRVSRASLRIERPALTCAYAIQPQVIRGLADQPAFRGRGLLGRFLYAAPPSWIGERIIGPPPVPEGVRNSYHNMMEQLASVSPVIEGEILILRFDDESDLALREFESEVEGALADGGNYEAIRDWAGKMAGAAVRIAGILHCVEFGPDGAIGVGTFRAAAKIARYLAPHADHVLRMMCATNGGTVDDSQYLLRWILRHDLTSFTKRDAHQHGRRRFPQPDNMDPALAELTRRGYIRPVVHDTSGPGRPPSPEFEVNPAVFENKNPGTRSHNSQNSGNGRPQGDCVNTVSAIGGFENEDFDTVTL
ncbi:MAG: DUF3987 domain-containing protein [Planctomycetota bacterium]|nr:DUF3987 domain-containing protein [Planctomycetota bacterium]